MFQVCFQVGYSSMQNRTQWLARYAIPFSWDSRSVEEFAQYDNADGLDIDEEFKMLKWMSKMTITIYWKKWSVYLCNKLNTLFKFQEPEIISDLRIFV